MAVGEVQLLLVDDDPSAIQVMSRMLAQYPHQRFAASGPDALRLARESPPDLMLLDADMPGMSGFETCAAFKADPALANVPVIFATSHAMPQIEIAALENGAVDFVSKPLVATRLMARVRARLRPKRWLDESWHERADLRAPQGAPLPRLLVVASEVGSIRLLRRSLCNLAELHFATSGDAALTIARRIGPDLILLDAQMPGLDSFGVCDTLKSELAFQRVSIVFLTGLDDAQAERRAFEIGAADYLLKPTTSAVLHARIRNLLDSKRRTDAELQAAAEHWRGVSDARIADIVRSSHEGIVSHDATGKVVLANAAACRLFGVAVEQVVGQPIRAMCGAAFRPGAPAPPHPVGHITLLRGRQALPPLTVEYSISSVGEGVQRLTTVVLRDPSDRERLAAEARTRHTVEARGGVKAIELAHVAHEMGNPLNAILGFAQVMATDSREPLPPAQAQRLNQVIASGQHMTALLHNLLDMGQAGSGHLHVELAALSLAACVEAARAEVAPLAVAAGVQLRPSIVPASARAMADPVRLRQCLVNLLSNAIKYNRRGGWVRIDVRCHGGQARIAVRDNGLGLDAAQRAHLFEPFNRLGHQGGTTPGTGLGMVVTRELVEAMRGNLLVESVAGSGSSFVLVLPEAGAAAQAAPRGTESHGNAASSTSPQVKETS